MGNFIILCALKQQTPMIHFQHREDGACLRGSDLKPKLDRFLLEQMEKGYATPKEAGRDIAGKNGWLTGDDARPALNYKVSVNADGTQDDRTLIKSNTIEVESRSLKEFNRTGKARAGRGDTPICRSYFGNMVEMGGARTPDEKIELVRAAYRETVFYTKPILLKLTCFIPELADLIREHLPGFFLLHNFGTRSNKGFGSYVISEIDGKPASADHEAVIAGYLPHPFYKVGQYQKPDYKQQMDDIADLYQLMKSGLNDRDEYYRAFIYEYMHRKGIGNEKAWMKQNRISPVLPENAAKGEHIRQSGFTDHRYVRAMLGIGDNIRYIKQLDKDGKPDFASGSTTVKIAGKQMDSDNKPLIQRFASPILFKVAGNCTYMLPFEPNQAILGQPFEFTGYKKMTLMTPEAFDMCDFAAQFADYINKPDTQSKLNSSRRLHFRGKLVQCTGGGDRRG